MFTFLRRIRRSSIVSGSTRKYLLYAIGEIALVVIGILIALQINNWNEWRKDRIQEKEILNDLRLNLESNILILGRRIYYFNKGQNSGKIVISVIDNNLLYHDSLDIHFFRATRGYGGADVISNVGYEALKNSGFDLISNKSLKDEVLKLFETTFRDIISFDETFKLQNSYHKEVVGELFYQDKLGSVKPFEFDRILKSDRYYSSVTDHYYNYEWMKEATIDGLSETERVLQLIKDELQGIDGS